MMRVCASSGYIDGSDLVVALTDDGALSHATHVVQMSGTDRVALQLLLSRHPAPVSAGELDRALWPRTPPSPPARRARLWRLRRRLAVVGLALRCRPPAGYTLASGGWTGSSDPGGVVAISTRARRGEVPIVAGAQSRVAHPSASAGAARRVVLVGVKAVDRAAVRAGEYAERIPAFERRGIHVATGPADDALEATWTALVPCMPLDVVHGEGVAEAFADAARAYVAAAGVNEVVVVLAPSRGGRDDGRGAPPARDRAAPGRQGRAHRPAVPARVISRREFPTTAFRGPGGQGC